jgi:predicted RNase H-like nuclease (RuvC/YqgF family)
MNKAKLLRFAKLLNCFQEIPTQNGNLISDDEISVGSEVFVIEVETGELVVAPNGTYENEVATYIVEGGKVVSIELKDFQPETVEEIVEEVEQPQEMEEALIVDVKEDENEAMKAENESLKMEIETLKAENENLKMQIEDLQKQLNEKIDEKPIEVIEDFKHDNPLYKAFNRK